MKSLAKMKKYKFVLNTGLSGSKETEIVELPSEYMEDEVESEFQEWVWNQLDAYYEKID